MSLQKITTVDANSIFQPARSVETPNVNAAAVASQTMANLEAKREAKTKETQAIQQQKVQTEREGMAKMLENPANAKLIAQSYGISYTPQLEQLLAEPRLAKLTKDALDASKALEITDMQAFRDFTKAYMGSNGDITVAAAAIPDYVRDSTKKLNVQLAKYGADMANSAARVDIARQSAADRNNYYNNRLDIAKEDAQRKDDKFIADLIKAKDEGGDEESIDALMAKYIQEPVSTAPTDVPLPPPPSTDNMGLMVYPSVRELPDQTGGNPELPSVLADLPPDQQELIAPQKPTSAMPIAAARGASNPSPPPAASKDYPYIRTKQERDQLKAKLQPGEVAYYYDPDMTLRRITN